MYINSLKVFKEQCMPIIEGYKGRNKVKVINSEDDEKKAFSDVLRAFAGLL